MSQFHATETQATPSEIDQVLLLLNTFCGDDELEINATTSMLDFLDNIRIFFPAVPRSRMIP